MNFIKNLFEIFSRTLFPSTKQKKLMETSDQLTYFITWVVASGVIMIIGGLAVYFIMKMFEKSKSDELAEDISEKPSEGDSIFSLG
ncbi:unnamed protein product [Auanema sp. JU1783]|nr:unnamed protein product [Auanema sp. JU1783]